MIIIIITIRDKILLVTFYLLFFKVHMYIVTIAPIILSIIVVIILYKISIDMLSIIHIRQMPFIFIPFFIPAPLTKSSIISPNPFTVISLSYNFLLPTLKHIADNSTNGVVGISGKISPIPPSKKDTEPIITNIVFFILTGVAIRRSFILNLDNYIIQFKFGYRFVSILLLHSTSAN